MRWEDAPEVSVASMTESRTPSSIPQLRSVWLLAWQSGAYRSRSGYHPGASLERDLRLQHGGLLSKLGQRAACCTVVALQRQHEGEADLREECG